MSTRTLTRSVALILVLAAGRASAQDPLSAGPAPEPRATRTVKVAVVVAGDPDARMQAAAEGVERAAADAGLVLPSDELVREVLCGASVTGAGDADGLDGLRAQRRALGLSREQDRAPLVAIARQTGAAMLVVAQLRADGAVELTPWYPAQGRYGSETQVWEATRATPVGRWIAAQVRRAPAPAAETGGGGGFLSRNWAFLAAGAALATFLVIVLATGRNDSPQTPVLRFVGGGSP